MKKQLTLLVLLLTFLLIKTIQAQIPAIDSLRIIPENPTTSDIVKVISNTTFPSGDCKITSSSVNITGAVITIYASHTLGAASFICHSKDTLLIGKLSVGTYQLYYHLEDTTPPTTYDVDTLNFTVQKKNNISKIASYDSQITIYPNPFSATTTVLLDNIPLTNTLEIRIYDILGQEIRRVTKIQSNEVNITRDNLTSGLYFIKVLRGDAIISNKKIIIE